MVFSLFENPAFMKKHGFSQSEVSTIKKWVEKANINWGVDSKHKQKIVGKKKDDLHVNSWDHGFERILSSFVYSDEMKEAEGEKRHIPIDGVSFSEAELFNKFISIFYEVREDIEIMQGIRRQKLNQWGLHIKKIIDKYLAVDESVPAEAQAYIKISSFIENLFSAGKTLREEKYDFHSIFKNMKRALNKSSASFNAKQTQGVSFYSLKEEILPSKIICAIGLNEDFPRKDPNNSFSNNSIKDRHAYVPQKIDKDRNLFLDMFMLSENKVFMSYVGINKTDGKKNLPSALLQEFCFYIDQAFSMEKEKISDYIFWEHPSFSFDKKYFQKEGAKFYSFSNKKFLAAKNHYLSKKKKYCFISDFNNIPQIDDNYEGFLPDVIDIKQMLALSSNPIKFYLNEVLDIYLKKEKEEPYVKDLSLSFLDYYLIKKRVVSQDIDIIVQKMEKEGAFPVGMFNDLAKEKIEAQVEAFFKNIRALHIDIDNIKNVELSIAADEIDEKRETPL